MFNISELFSTIDSLSVDEAREMLEEKGQDEVVLVDVREPAEYQDEHIPGSVLMPLSRLLDELHSLPVSKTLIVYCKRGVRSRSATALLKRSGFRKVFNMKGGMSAWKGVAAYGEYETGLYLLEGKSSSRDLISMAVALEEGARLFYETARNYVSDENSKAVFDQLVNAEVKHKGLLLKSYGKPLEKASDSESADSPVAIMESGVPVQDLIDWLNKEKRTVSEILELSMQIETNSLDLYMKMLQKIKDDKTREAIIALIKEEKAHLALLGDLLGKQVS